MPSSNLNILSTDFDSYMIQWKNDAYDYPDLLNRFRQGVLESRQLSNQSLYRKVWWVKVDGREFVIKKDVETDKRLEKKIWAWLTGSSYSRLIKCVSRAISQGCLVVQDVYLVAEKKSSAGSPETWSIFEYVPGDPINLSQEGDSIDARLMCAQSLQTLHSYGLASNDTHSGNFIFSEQGCKIIDLNLNSPIIFCQANDIINMKIMFDVDIPANNLSLKLACFLVSIASKSRKFFRFLRGKI